MILNNLYHNYTKNTRDMGRVPKNVNYESYINALLAEHRCQTLAAEMIAVLKQNAEEPRFS